MIRIVSRDKLVDLMPLLDLPVEEKIVLICHRPPDIRISRQTSDRVIKVYQVVLLCHVAVAPAVIRKEKDQIDLNAQIEKALQFPLKVCPECEIRSVCVERFCRTFPANIVEEL